MTECFFKLKKPYFWSIFPTFGGKVFFKKFGYHEQLHKGF